MGLGGGVTAHGRGGSCSAAMSDAESRCED